jgi:hypothetical protein
MPLSSPSNSPSTRGVRRGDILKPRDLKLGDDVRYAPRPGNPEPCAPYSTWRVVACDGAGQPGGMGVTLRRPYIRTVHEGETRHDTELGFEEQWFPLSQDFSFIILDGGGLTN